MLGGTNLPRVGGYNQAVVLDAIRTSAAKGGERTLVT
jgi:hypothetical protein